MATYKYGSSGTGVAELQRKLNEKGNYGLADDGIYGEKTRDAVEDYQTRNNLTIDGLAGPETQQSLGISSNGTTAQNAPTTTVNSQTERPSVQQTAQSNLSVLQKGQIDPLGESIDTLYDKIINQKAFEYNPSTDPTYNQYAEIYKKNAKLMSEDAMAQASTLTGGFGSSYGQAVGTQAYNEQMSNINNIVPELRQNAYNEWNDQRARDIEALSLLLNERDYERAIFESDRAFDESVRQYNAGLAEEQRQFDINRKWTERTYNDERNALAVEAGFSSWDDYVKAVSSGEYKSNEDPKIESFSNTFLDGAVKAYQEKGEDGLTAYFDVYGNEYSEEQLTLLGENIVGGYTQNTSSNVTYPEDVPVISNIASAEDYLKKLRGLGTDDDLSGEDEEFLESLLSYDEMKSDKVDDENDTTEAYNRYLSWRLSEYLKNSKYSS